MTFVFDTDSAGKFIKNLPINVSKKVRNNTDPATGIEPDIQWYKKYFSLDNISSHKNIKSVYFYPIFLDTILWEELFLKRQEKVRLHDYIENDINNGNCFLILDQSFLSFYVHGNALTNIIFELFDHLDFEQIIFLTSNDDTFDNVDFKFIPNKALSVEAKEQGWVNREKLLEKNKINHRKLKIQHFNLWERRIAYNWKHPGRPIGIDEFNDFKNNYINHINSLTERSYYFCCYNRQPRHERLLFLAHLELNNLLDKGIWSLGAKLNQHLYGFNNIEDITNDKDLGNIINKLISNGNTKNWSRSNFNLDNNTNALALSYDDIFNSYFNIIVETNVDSDELLMSEKTYKAILSLQLPLCLGNPFTIKKLQYDGYDVFEDFIDHSYDNELDLDIRIKLLVKEIKRLCTIPKKDINLFYKNNISRLIHNYNNLITGCFNRTKFWEKYVQV